MTYNNFVISSSTSFLASSLSASLSAIQSSSANTNIDNKHSTSLYDMGFKFRNILSILTTSQTTVASNSSSKPVTKSHRASSEPLPKNGDMDMPTPPADNLPRSQSEYHLPFSEDHTSMETVVTKSYKELALNTMEEEAPLSHPPCPPSPAATEIHDPESQDIITQIQFKGIKVRDFAYPSATSPSAPRLSPVPEIFDQYKGLAEVEYRWTQSHRTYPIQGKTLSRLIDMGWIGQEELSARVAPMDLEELRKHNARQPMYPWKPFCWTTIPTLEERKAITHARSPYFHQWDRFRAEAEFQEMRKLRLERETREVEEKMREREREKQEALALSQAKGKGREVGSHKRRHEDDDTTNILSDRESDFFSDGETESKKRRLSVEQPEDLYPAFLIPLKQYPAPLHTYDPEIYPEAAYAIGSSSQSQPRPIVPQRTDTPPLSDDEDTKRSPGGGAKLVHPKKARALKRQLSRTQTYTQL